MAEFPNVNFIKVNPLGKDGDINERVSKEIHEWSKNKNISYMSFKKFNKKFELGLTNDQ